jgi:transposase
MRRINMLKAREILRLRHEVGLSLREIGKSCNCGKTTVAEVLERAKKAKIEWPINLSDKQLISLLYPPTERKNMPPEPDMEYVFYEMKKKGVTLMLLWEEYKEQHPEGIMYTQFCERYRKFKKNNNLTMHIEHTAGEEMMVDWAGQKMYYTEPTTGEKRAAYIFVAVLPASAYPFVYAYSNTKLQNWIDAHVKAYEHFKGVPTVTISDNDKSAVITPDLFDPVLNRSYYDMAKHYGTTLVPARVAHPKDKAADENMVGNVSRRILAPLRNRQFFSVHGINQAIREELEKFIRRPFQKMEGNRLTAFEKTDKPLLKPLPKTRYEYCDWKEAKVQFNYHVEYQKYYYSTHYTYVGKRCWVRATSRVIEIFIESEGTLGIASEIEIRLLKKPKYTWGGMFFFQQEENAVKFVRLLRENRENEYIENARLNAGFSERFIDIKPVAIEYFNSESLDLLRRQNEREDLCKHFIIIFLY